MAFNFGFSKLSGSGFKNSRPPYEGAYIYGLLFFIGMLTSNYVTTFVRANMLPIGGITKVKTGPMQSSRKKKVASVFKSVEDKNIFNSDHFIPESLGEKMKGEGGLDNSAPVLTSLPLKLLGTIIHGAREKSVATVQVSGKDIQAVMADEEIKGMAKIREITRYKVIFRNMRSRKLEYIEIKEDSKIKMGLSNGKKLENFGDATEKTNFVFKREEINKYLENLPRVLQDAKAVPYVAPGSGGEISGFKLVAIKAGSVYEKLGLKRGDIIKNVNGEPVDTPQKAMELYQTLKNAENIQLGIDRSGSPTTMNYMVE